ncbi:unnamed protein product [Acanthoscelides obtectus]|uniref:Uncharacterized protein n=1 Tax=Acanthoscelides obtectus TaxID=200917 RepID=A0A9P0KXP5_ACAOB|nr:unnamed protein product [Acanthoscelides obtectus]CAK1631219.1 hypothetical protein AOBTE_LOCUS6821 [Acanthoscelides obtectus]
MSKHGTYYVKNEAKDKDRSFTYFICSLAIFLLVLLTIYSILVYYTGNLKKMQNRIVDRNAQTSATDSIIAHATHETVRLNKTSTKSVAAESNVTYSGDILEKNLDENHTNKPDFSTPVIKRFTDYLQPLHGRSEFEPTNMFESDNATTRHPNYTSETSDEYTPSLASPSQQSTIVTDSTVSSNDALATIVQDQDTSAMKQSSLGEIDSNESSFTATQSPLVTNSTETIQALDSIHGTIIQHNLEYSTEKSNILYGTDSGSYSTIVSDSTKCIQALNGAPGTHFIQTTTKKYLEEGIEKSNVEMYESSATIYSKLAGDSTEWIQKLKDVPESPSTPTSIQQNLDRSTEKSKVLHETYPGASITYPKLLTDSKGWIQMVKGVPATSFISTTTPRLEDDMKTINGLDEKYSTEIGFTKMKLYNHSSNNMPDKFSSTPDYQGIHTEKQNVLDEINSDTPHPSNRSREFPELTKSANSSSSKFFTAETPVFFEKTSPVVPSSSISRSKMFVQSGASNELQNISMTTTIFGSEEKLSDTYTRTRTKAQPIIREPTEENTTFITPQNVTTSPYRESKITFSSIVELLSVTGSLLPLTASLEDKNQTKVSTPDVRDVAITQTTLSNNDRKLDLESFNKLDGDICDSHICKRAASKALYQINFDADVCKNPYAYFCDGGKVKKWDFLSIVFKHIISFIEKIDENSATYFQVFGKTFDMCNKISSMNVFEQVKIDDDTFPKDYKDAIGELLLTKSLPLFDMNVDPIGNLFQIQISPPSLKLQTSQSTFRWSLLDHIRSSCMNEITQTLNATIDMKVIKNKSKECCKKKLLSYIQKYVATIDQSSTRDLQTIILKVYDRWIEKYFFETHEDSENNFVNMTMEDFCDSKDYNLGVDWRHLFSMMGIPYNETILIRIYYPKEVKMVISEVKSNKR